MGEPHMKNRKRVGFVRAAAAFLALVLFAAPLSAFAADTNVADEIEAERQSLTAQRAELEDRLAALENTEEKKEVRQALLEEQIETTEAQIDAAVRSIDTLNENIRSLEAEIEASNREIDGTMELLKKRLAALYQAGTVSVLEILCNAESLYDFSLRMEFVSRITHHDRELIDGVTAHMQETSAQREALQRDREELAQERKLLESSRAALTKMKAENQALIEEIRAEQGTVETALRRTEAEENALADRMAVLIAEMQAKEAAAQAAQPSPTAVPTFTPEPLPEQTPEPTPEPEPSPEPEYTPEPESSPEPETPEDPGPQPSPEPEPTPEPTLDPEPITEPTVEPEPLPEPEPGPFPESGQSFLWPVPGQMGISDTFGNGHYGLDIPAPYGTPIVASRSGTVMIANNTDDWGDSWGFYVSIYHDGTYSTLYAHMSAVAVVEGQWVEQGQIIGYVGSTGYSTGDHCHFEVYQNGTRVDPQQFV